MLSLSTSMCIHNVFHVSLLKKYVHDANHVIDWNVIQVEHEGDFWVEPICILDRKGQSAQEKIHRDGKGSMDLLFLKMLHGSMKKTCRINTHKFLTILRRT
jgi:hypothetical protein